MSAPTDPEEHIYKPIAAAIKAATNVASFFGAKHLSSQNAPPRYVWVPATGSASYELTPNSDVLNHGDEDPESLGNIDYTFEVHCWHGTHDEAWALMRNLVKATRDALSDAQYRIGGVDALPNDIGLRGWVITASLVVTIPLWDPGTEWVRVKFTDAVLDDSQGNETDGVLTAPNK